MSRLDQHVAAVQNRLAIDRFSRALAWTALFCLFAVLLMVIVDRAVQWRPPRPVIWIASGLGLAVVAALIHAIRRRPSRHQAAIAIDTKLGLDEKICTALYARPSSDPFAMAAVKDAEATAQNVALQAGRHFPFQFPKAAYGTILVAAAALAATQLPSMDLLGREEAKKKVVVQQQKADFAKKQLQDALAVVDAVPQSIANDEVIKLAKQDLTTSLKNGVDDPAKASRTALKALQDVDAAVKQQIKSNVQFAQAKADEKMWKQIGDQPITDPGPVNEARKELADGKFSEAINDLSNVVNNFDKMDKKDQEKATEQMKQMAQQLAQQANNPQQQQQQQQQLQQMGMNQQMAQQAQQLLQQAANGNQQAQQQLQQMAQQAVKQMNNGQGPNPQQQQQVQQMMQQMQAAANNQAQAQQLAQAAQQMAQAMQQQAQQGQQAGQPAQKGQQGAQQANKGQQAQQQANGQGNQQKPGGQQGAQGNQPGGQQAQAQMGQGMQQMQQQLQQMQAVAADAQQIAAAQQAAQQGAQQAMNGANAGQAGNAGQPGGNGQWPGNNGGQQGGPPPNGQWQGQANNGLAPNNGGQGAGDRSGKAYAPYTVKAEVSPSQDNENGRLLASTFVKAGTVKGESKEQLKEVAASAMKDATDEIDQQRVSRQAQKVVREYFSSMQKDAEGAPAPDDSHK